MRTRRFKLSGCDAVYHCMTRTVNGERLFEDREKEVLRKMIHQVADFSGVRVLTYCVMSNHFHVLLHVPREEVVSDKELMRRYRVLYPKPTNFQTASIAVLERDLKRGGEDAERVRRQLLSRMGDVSEFMKTVKQRFSVWFNKSHQRYGTLWADRFKSVLVEGAGNPLQTMAAYIDLNPVRAGLVEDPKDYRFCGYAEAVAGVEEAIRGIEKIWADFGPDALIAHRRLIFGKHAAQVPADSKARSTAVKVLEQGETPLPRQTVLRCRVRYFSEGVIFGSKEFVQNFASTVQRERRRKFPPRPNSLQGADWGDLAVIQNFRKEIFS